MADNIRNIISFLLILTISASSVSSCKKEDDPESHVKDGTELTVIAERGLILRETPSTDGQRITTIPYGEQVKTIESTSKRETIDGRPGQWLKVSYSEKKGYSFDSYLRPRLERGAADECTPFILHNMICYPERHLKKLKNKISNEITTGYEPIPLTLEIFDILPAKIPGSEVFVITADDVFTGKIESISLSALDIGPAYLEFSLAGFGRPEYGSAIYLDATDPALEKTDPPEIIKTEKRNNKSRELELTENILSSHSLPVGPGDLTNSIEDVLKNYTPELYYAEIPESDINFEILKVRNKDREQDFYDFNAVFINSRLVHGEHSKIISLFTYNSINYIAKKRWTPHTGDISIDVYSIEKKAIKPVQSDYTFSN